MFPRENWSYSVAPNEIAMWFVTHHAEGLPWFLFASTILSIIIYSFVASSEMVRLKPTDPQPGLEAVEKKEA